MQYMCLIYSAEGTGPQPGTDAFGPFMKGYQDFTAEMAETKRLAHGDALQPIATATTVPVRDGKTITTDGPFAETKEQLGGFYVIDAKDLDEAIEIAAMIPGAIYGTVEVRPIVDFG